MFHLFTWKLIVLWEEKYLKNEFFGIQVNYLWDRTEGDFLIYPHIDDTKHTVIYTAFDTAEQKGVFLRLLKISWIGIKTASIIGNSTEEDIKNAIKETDFKFFTSIPGIWQKTAKRIILELKSTFGKDDIQKLSENPETTNKIIKTLSWLWYQKTEIKKALNTYKGKIDENSMTDIVKYVLEKLK